MDPTAPAEHVQHIALLTDLRVVPEHQMQNRPYDHATDGM